MKSNLLAVYVVLASALGQPFLAYGATEQDLQDASSPIMAARVGASNRLYPTRQTGRAVVIVDGEPVNFPSGGFVRAQGSLMVPLRAIGEALGAQVTYNAASGTVAASRAGFQLTLREDIYTSGGATLVPLRTLSESLGIQVSVTNAAGLMRIELSVNDAEDGGTTEVAAPPSQPAQSGNGEGIDASIQYNLKQLNVLRARAGVPALKLDAQLNAFARQGSIELMKTHVPHGHFTKADVWKNGFDNNAAENQGDPNGWFPGPLNQSIDQILKAMMDEGPGGGHHDAIINPAFKRVGIGLVKDGNGRLYFTNDFSG
ncbi:hypothetical protein EON83_25160 [bacterium]|nr:MAG: hypothetical protein EON83_25160 [bacterium]